MLKSFKSRLQSDSRSYESNIEDEYLLSLNKRYAEWIDSYEGEVLRINVDECNFESDDEKFLEICKKIDQLESEKQ